MPDESKKQETSSDHALLAKCFGVNAVHELQALAMAEYAYRFPISANANEAISKTCFAMACALNDHARNVLSVPAVLGIDVDFAKEVHLAIKDAHAKGLVDDADVAEALVLRLITREIRAKYNDAFPHLYNDENVTEWKLSRTGKTVQCCPEMLSFVIKAVLRAPAVGDDKLMFAPDERILRPLAASLGSPPKFQQALISRVLAIPDSTVANIAPNIEGVLPVDDFYQRLLSVDPELLHKLSLTLELEHETWTDSVDVDDDHEIVCPRAALHGDSYAKIMPFRMLLLVTAVEHCGGDILHAPMLTKEEQTLVRHASGIRKKLAT